MANVKQIIKNAESSLQQAGVQCGLLQEALRGISRNDVQIATDIIRDINDAKKKLDMLDRAFK